MPYLAVSKNWLRTGAGWPPRRRAWNHWKILSIFRFGKPSAFVLRHDWVHMCGFPLTTQEPNCRLLEFPDSQDKNLSNWLFRGQPWMEPMQTHIWEELPGRNHRDSLLGKSDRPGDFHFWVRDDHYHDGDCGCGADDPFYETTFFWLLVASNLSSFSCWSLNLANFSSFSACANFLRDFWVNFRLGWSRKEEKGDDNASS